MKKLLIVLLSVLLLLSAVSCEKDRTDEVVQTYVDFKNTFSLANNLVSCFKSIIADNTDYSTNVIDLASSTDKPYFTSPFMERFVSIENKQKIVQSDVTSTGTISGTTVDKDDISFNSTSYTITYQVCNADDSVVKDNQTLSLTLNGSYKKEEKDGEKTLTASFTLNDVEYEISYSRNQETNKFTSAKVNGTDVNLTLLNAQVFKGM